MSKQRNRTHRIKLFYSRERTNRETHDSLRLGKEHITYCGWPNKSQSHNTRVFLLSPPVLRQGNSWAPRSKRRASSSPTHKISRPGKLRGMRRLIYQQEGSVFRVVLLNDKLRVVLDQSGLGRRTLESWTSITCACVAIYTPNIRLRRLFIRLLVYLFTKRYGQVLWAHGEQKEDDNPQHTVRLESYRTFRSEYDQATVCLECNVPVYRK